MKRKALESFMRWAEALVDVGTQRIVSAIVRQQTDRAVALLSYNDGTEEFSQLVNLDSNVLVSYTFRVDRAGPAHLKLTQMGNVAIVMDSIRVGPMSVCSGPTVAFTFNTGAVGVDIIVYCKVLK
jgi:hypothetical protein